LTLYSRWREAVDWIGAGIDQWSIEASPLEVFRASPGVWIWEGHVEGEGEYRRLLGSYRVLTDTEWEEWVESMQAGGAELGPWDDSEWVMAAV